MTRCGFPARRYRTHGFCRRTQRLITAESDRRDRRPQTRVYEGRAGLVGQRGPEPAGRIAHSLSVGGISGVASTAPGCPRRNRFSRWRGPAGSGG